MNLKLACADFTFPLLPHDKVLDLIAAMDFEGVDIGLFEGRSHLWPSTEFARLSESARTLRRKLEDRRLRCADVFLQMNPDFVPLAINQPDPAARRKARDVFLQTLDYAKEVGSHHVMTLPGVYFESEPKEVSWSRSLEELAWRLEKSINYGLVFSFEAHVGSLASDPTEAERLVASIPGLSLTLDYTHFTRIGFPDSAIEPLVKYASHFHVRGAKPGRLQVNFKSNVIDYAGVLRAMRNAGYHGYLGIEYIWMDWEQCNESDNVSETIQFRDLLRAEMKKQG